jgi:hypothetical protein
MSDRGSEAGSAEKACRDLAETDEPPAYGRPGACVGCAFGGPDRQGECSGQPAACPVHGGDVKTDEIDPWALPNAVSCTNRVVDAVDSCVRWDWDYIH